ncbi:MAG: hypothetical protein V3V41_00215 [Candidatus Heimdallarchaeota archaeon]
MKSPNEMSASTLRSEIEYVKERMQSNEFAPLYLSILVRELNKRGNVNTNRFSDEEIVKMVEQKKIPMSEDPYL